MTYLGTIHNGVVVLPPEAHLPEGAEVKVESLAAKPTTAIDSSGAAASPPDAVPELLTEENDELLRVLRSLAKPRPDWPEDFVVNHGYYIDGEPKR